MATPAPSLPGFNQPGPGLSGPNTWGWIVTAVALLGIAIGSMFMHDVAIEHLGIPYPAVAGAPAWLPVLGHVGRLAALVLFCHVARSSLDKYRLVAASALIGLLAAFLAEAIRVPIIEFFLTNAWLDGRWLFTLISLLPRLAIGLAQGFLAVPIARAVAPKNLALAIAAAILGGIALRLAVSPFAELVATSLDTLAHVSQSDELYRPPYGPGMLTVIYLTFLEPTIACFIMARLAWPGLPGSAPVKLGVFTLLILGATGRLTLILVSSFWVKQPPILAFLSTAQFVVEIAVMAALTGWLWSRSIAPGNRRLT